MSAENYRHYCLDGSGRLHDASWLRAASDADAVAQVEAKYPGSTSEIWLGRRLVAKIEPAHLSA